MISFGSQPQTGWDNRGASYPAPKGWWSVPRRAPVPVVRHSYAPDPNPEKVRAALDLWRTALARKMAQAQPKVPAQEDETRV